MPSKKRLSKILKGTAARDSLHKTVPVAVAHIKTHPIYQKRYRSEKIYLAHCEEPIKKGQLVEIVPTRPISKRKTWKVVKSK